jgi:peroxiredoxin
MPINILRNFRMLLVLVSLAAFVPRCAVAGANPGDRAPDFELEDLGGRIVSLSDILSDGKPVVLSFFGTWCEICLKEINDFPEITKDSNALVYLVGLDADKEKLARFVAKEGIKYPVLWDPKARMMGRKYEVLRGAILLVPKTVVIAPSGTLEYTAESYDEQRKADLAAKLALLKDKKWDKPSELAVFFTGSINGRLKPGYSARKNGGSLIKLLPFLKQQTAKYPNSLLVDTGDFLPYGVTPAKAEPVLKAMALAGYDAIAVGDQDLNYSGFLAAAGRKELPFVATTLALKDPDGGLPGLPEKILTAGEVRVRILSFVEPDAFSFYPEEFSGQFELKDLKEALKDGKKADLLILLSHAGMEENKKIAAEFKELDLVIGGHSQEAAGKPEKAGNAVIVQAGSNLQAVGKMMLRFDGARKLAGSTYEALPLPDTIPDDPRIAALAQESKGQSQPKGR